MLTIAGGDAFGDNSDPEDQPEHRPKKRQLTEKLRTIGKSCRQEDVGGDSAHTFSDAYHRRTG